MIFRDEIHWSFGPPPPPSKLPVVARLLVEEDSYGFKVATPPDRSSASFRAGIWPGIVTNQVLRWVRLA